MFIDVRRLKVGVVIHALSAAAARRLQALPLRHTCSGLLLAIAAPPSQETIDGLRRETGKDPEFALAEPKDLAEAIERAYSA